MSRYGIVWFFLAAIFLYGNDFDDAIASMRKRRTKEVHELMRYVKSLRIKGYTIKNNRVSIEAEAELLSVNKPYVGVVSRAAPVVYKDGEEINFAIGVTEISTKTLEDDGKGHWKKMTKYRYVVNDRYDAKAHEYIFSIHKLSDSSGAPFCILKYRKIRIEGDPKLLRQKAKLYKEIVSELQTKIEKAREACLKSLKAVRDKSIYSMKDMRERTRRFKEISDRILHNECPVKMDYGTITVADAYRKIDRYNEMIGELNDKTLPAIDDDNIVRLKKRYFDEIDDPKKFQLQKKHEEMLRRIDRLDLSQHEFTDFISSLGWGDVKERDEASLRRWRERAKKALEKGWVKALAIGNTRALSSQLKRELDIINKYRDADRLMKDADADVVVANQQLTYDIVSTVPFLDTSFDVLNVIRGEDIVGNKLGTMDYLFSVVPTGISFAQDLNRWTKNAIARNGRIKRAIEGLKKRLDPLNKAVKTEVAKRLKVVKEKIELDPKFLTKSMLADQTIKAQSLRYKSAQDWVKKNKIFRAYQERVKHRSIHTDMAGSSKLHTQRKDLLSMGSDALEESDRYFQKMKAVDKRVEEATKSAKRFALQVERLTLQDEGIRRLEQVYRESMEPMAKKYLGSTKKIPVEIRKGMQMYADVIGGKRDLMEVNFIIERGFGMNPQEFSAYVKSYLKELQYAQTEYQSAYSVFLRSLKKSAKGDNFIKLVNMTRQAFSQGEISPKEYRKLRKELSETSYKMEAQVRERVKALLEAYDKQREKR